MSSELILPTYIPSPYAFAGHSLLALPSTVQHYLTHCAGLTPPAPAPPTRATLAAHRAHLASATHRALQGIDIAFVEARRDARHEARRAAYTAAELADADARDAARIETVCGLLLPERARALDEFVARIDALVWLELEGAWTTDDSSGPPPAGAAEQQVYRDAVLGPLLDGFQRALVDLDRIVTEREEEARTPVEGVQRIPWRRRNSATPEDLNKSIQVLQEQVSKLTIQKLELLGQERDEWSSLPPTPRTPRTPMGDMQNTFEERDVLPWRKRRGTVHGKGSARM
ncbi:hypothetical protein FA95DRAFT_1562243 [Auriscalpium vulgare]|uniref:Uncharacterized protein n=1 Tax=Auriscalpium vulgare TaxID=40419 RepID=A0ACB8RK55_9AGAM|nr:hypothetical protein FA95DRAFT_1562243 [Auriscalpium vulgare]